jgi:hypothetical protein
MMLQLAQESRESSSLGRELLALGLHFLADDERKSLGPLFLVMSCDILLA